MGIAVTTLRQDVGLNPDSAVLAREIEPVQRPRFSPAPEESQSDKTAFDQMLNYSPALAGMRESIRSALIQVKYSENQTLPQLNLGAQFGVTSEAGDATCTASITVPSYANCFTPRGPVVRRAAQRGRTSFRWRLRFSTEPHVQLYLLRLCSGAGLFDAARQCRPQAALAQARVSLEQTRLQYRQAFYQAALQVKSALVNLRAYKEQVVSTGEATSYARESLHDVQVEFRIGTATTNQLLQYQSNLVTAQSIQVQADWPGKCAAGALAGRRYAAAAF